MSLPLAGAVALVALAYAMVGHAGATGYIAVMSLAGMSPAAIRPTALVLNVLVAAIGTAQFARAGHFRGRLFLPLAVASVPCALVGGAITLPTRLLEVLLGFVLVVSAARLVWGGERSLVPEAAADAGRQELVLRWLVGGAIGLLSGLTGVGGGVFLTPVLVARRAGTLPEIAAVTAPFILVNSLAGLAGAAWAGRVAPPLDARLVVAAGIGGLVGSWLGAFRLPQATLRLVLAAVLAFAGLRLVGGAS